MEDVAIVGARRSYEFLPDQLKLSLVSNDPALRHLQEALGFDYAAVVQPPDTFGPVPASFPPGLVFSYGVVPFPDDKLTPVRFLHLEPRRIVIDVAGPSTVIDEVYRQFRDLLKAVDEASGDTVATEPMARRDQSEISFRGAFDPSALLPAGISRALADVWGIADPAGRGPVPSLTVRPWPHAVGFASEGVHPSWSYWIDLRAGYPPEDRVYSSVAPLDTDAHLQLLERLDAALAV